MKKGKIILMWSQPLIETLPNNQPMICLNSSPVKAIIKEISAPKKELKMTPVKIIVSTRNVRSIRLAKKRTIKMVMNEARILNTGNVKVPKIGRDSPKKIVTTAPTEAPEETPNV